MARDLAIDLGTANTLVYARSEGIVLAEPSVIALNENNREVLAMGSDVDITQRMVRLILQRAGVSRFNKPRVVICVPSAITPVERRAVTEACRRAGASDAQLIEQPLAAAIGANLPISEAFGSMVVDIGGGTSEIMREIIAKIVIDGKDYSAEKK